MAFKDLTREDQEVFRIICSRQGATWRRFDFLMRLLASACIYDAIDHLVMLRRVRQRQQRASKTVIIWEAFDNAKRIH